MAQTDRDALVALYNATGGADWKKKNNWNTDADLSQWHGVTVDTHGRVVGLNLVDNKLRGPLSKELGALSELKKLRLHSSKRSLSLLDDGHRLEGPIPPELGNLRELTVLWLYENQLTGPIPKELGALSKLESLRLNSNQLTGRIPKELGALSKLESLRLNSNQLTGKIPEELGKLTALQKLILYDNQLSGPIPPELGNLRELTILWLIGNQLTGTIPPGLGNLRELQGLGLGNNQLTGPIPKELGSLSELKELKLYWNKLTGHIPPELGNLNALVLLHLHENQLSGSIPKELGALSKLRTLGLNGNKLVDYIPTELGNLAALETLNLGGNQLYGYIPAQLGDLGALKYLHLNNNKLDGPIPKELGAPSKLERLWLEQNGLTGNIPPELGNLSALRELYLYENQLSGTIPSELGNLTALETLSIRMNQLSGGPTKNESARSWTMRLRRRRVQKRAEEKSNESVPAWRSWLPRPQSEPVKQKRAEQKAVQQSGAEENARLQLAGTKTAPADRVSSSGERDSRLFREQIASFAELDELARKNQRSLEEMQRLMTDPASGSVPSATELTDPDKLQELDRLLAMAKTLGDVASIYMEDKDMQRKEMSLGPGPEAHYTAVRSGLCNAYLAASVVGSGLVSTSKVGAMGKAGTALKLISGAVPLVGGLAGFAGAALKAGDCFIQTRQVVKITELAADAVECSKLAKSLALRLTDGLPDGTIPMTQDAHEHRNAAGMGWGSGDFTSHEGSGVFAEGVNEEAVMEWFIEEVASCEPSNCGGTTPIREVQAGRHLGKRHLHKLLTAVGRGCLEGTKTAEEKANRLFLVVLPEADSRLAETPNASEGVFIHPPVSAPSHDGGVQQLAAELEAVKAAIKSTKEKNDTEVEALKAAMNFEKEKHHAELEALKADKEKHHAEVEALKGKITTLEKRLPESHGGLWGSVDAGGGYIFAQEQKTETREEFNERMENPARAADRQTATTDELRLTQAYVEEVDTRLGARVAALEETRGKK